MRQHLRARLAGRDDVDGRESGSVTAELAVTLPAVILLLAFLLTSGAAGITQLRLEEAARAGARALARGETEGEVQGIVQRIGGEEASVHVGSDGDWFSVTATARAGGAVGPLILWDLSATAIARQEVPGK